MCRIAVSVILYARTYNENLISFCHIVVEGSSQWIIGGNRSSRLSLEYFWLQPDSCYNHIIYLRISMYDHEVRSHINMNDVLDFVLVLSILRHIVRLCY